MGAWRHAPETPIALLYAPFTPCGYPLRCTLLDFLVKKSPPGPLPSSLGESPAGAIARTARMRSRRGHCPHCQEAVTPGPSPARLCSGYTGAIARTARKGSCWGYALTARKRSSRGHCPHGLEGLLSALLLARLGGAMLVLLGEDGC